MQNLFRGRSLMYIFLSFAQRNSTVVKRLLSVRKSVPGRKQKIKMEASLWDVLLYRVICIMEKALWRI